VLGFVIRLVVEANVAQVVIARFSCVLKHCRLKDRHLHRALNARLPGVNQFRIYTLGRHTRPSAS
jgi:hypothetical protein